MITVILYLLANFGFAYIVGFSKISVGARELLDPGVALIDGRPKFKSVGQAVRYWLLSLLECPSCIGFWTGGASGVLLVPNIIPPLWTQPQAMFVFFGCVVAGSNLLCARAARLI